MTASSTSERSDAVRPPRLLASIALSPRAAAVAAEAAALARMLGADLTLIHAGAETPDAEQEIRRALRTAHIDEGEARIVIRSGRVEDVICRYAAETGTDLIVAGALEKEGALQYFLGSVARRIARHAPCSVLLLSEPRLPPAPYHSIVAAVKFDEVSSEMMRFVVQLASRGRSTELHVVSEYDLAGVRMAIAEGSSTGGADQSRRAIHAAEHVRLTSFLQEVDLKGVRPVVDALEGKDGWEPVQYARRVHADLLFFPAPAQAPSFWDKLFQHGYEYALQSLPCALCLYRAHDAGANAHPAVGAGQ